MRFKICAAVLIGVFGNTNAYADSFCGFDWPQSIISEPAFTAHPAIPRFPWPPKPILMLGPRISAFRNISSLAHPNATPSSRLNIMSRTDYSLSATPLASGLISMNLKPSAIALIAAIIRLCDWKMGRCGIIEGGYEF